MAHTLLFSGYGAPGCDDLAVCRLTADGTLETLSTLRHGRAPSFCCRGQNGWIYAASERGDGADVTAYVLDGTTLREIARIEIPTGRGLCHLYACGDVIYGSCFENGLYFAVDSALTRILWQFQPAGANAHWVQSVGHALFLADLGNSRLYRLALENNLPTGSVKTLPQPTGSGPRQVLDAGDGMLDCVYELDGHMRVLNHDGCTVSTVQASTVPKPRSWPGGACATADGTLFVSNRGPNTISAWQRSGPTRHFLCEWPTGDWPRALCAVPAPCICWLPANERARCIATIVHPCPTAHLPKPPALRCLVLPARWCWTDFCHCIFSFPHFLIVQAFLLCTITSYLHLSLWQSPYRKSGISLSLLFGMGFCSSFIFWGYRARLWRRYWVGVLPIDFLNILVNSSHPGCPPAPPPPRYSARWCSTDWPRAGCAAC